MRTAKKIVFSLCYVVIANLSFGKGVPQEYIDLAKKADSLHRLKKFKESAITYSSAFKTLGWKGLLNDRYNAACAWTLAGYPDSAFFNLERIANAFRVYYSNYNQVISDSALFSLHTDKRWKSLLEKIKTNQQKGEINPNISLAEQLAIIFSDDQKYRKMSDSIKIKFGYDSKELQDVFRTIGEKDFFNLIKVKYILDTYGWLGADSIGISGNEALFLVIQHADLETQEKYFPMMKAAVADGTLEKSSFALLQDRMNLSQGKKQIYGSQIRRDNQTNLYYVRPLEDPDNVNMRRKEVGLESLEDYVKMWNIEWDVEQYKKDLPAIESKEKLKNNNN